MERREVLKLGSAAAAGLALGTRPRSAMAGPFDENEYRKIIPADKKLLPEWVQALYARGEKQTYRNEELNYIGMPVGGIGAGLVYLGGDGRLWMWDIFNKQYARGFMGRGAGGDTYLNPFEQVHPFEQGFELRVIAGEQAETFSLDKNGFDQVTFDGRYPMGSVRYEDPFSAVDVTLEAFSPFVPLDLENSSYPATVMRYTLKNKSSSNSVEAELAGWTDNPVCLYTGRSSDTLRENAIVPHDGLTVLRCGVTAPEGQAVEKRPDILFDDFERNEYGTWTAEGTAFGTGPALIDAIPSYQGDVNGLGKRVINSHATAPGKDVREKDNEVGTLLSGEFAIERSFISFRIGGGEHNAGVALNTSIEKTPPQGTGIHLLVDGKILRSCTGHNVNRMRSDFMDVGPLEGKTARLLIVDQVAGGWGNIGIDHIVFTDESPTATEPLEDRHDYGTFALALVGNTEEATAAEASEEPVSEATRAPGQPLVGRLSKRVKLAPGESATVTFVVAWHLPNNPMPGPFNRDMGRWYTKRFADAAAVAEHVATNVEELYEQTRTWVDTWYDSTLPFWLLDRTMANTSTLATSVCYLFEDGRFYGWEGVNCCPGTCTHVWHYAQAVGRLFPEISRDQRRRVDFGLALGEDGAIHYRGEVHDHHADDGQCGRILGVLREHQMSPDDGFLREIWPKVKKAVEFMLRRDPNGDGLLDGPQPNTLDAAWYGQISFTSSLYLAMLRAAEAMAREMNDPGFAERCAAIAERGAKSILGLYNGEYFTQIEDPAHADKIGVGPGCYIDQVFGQTWAHWVGLGEIFDREKQLSALRALWKYNFVPDVGPFREHFELGRWYAKAGDAGLIMCSWPKEQVDPAKKKHWQYGYFNECMSGFEWQAAAHMIWEGHDQPDLLEKGLAIARAIHDRYDARLRNPYNEIECSDHYARAMASYGVFQAVCGFNLHGPNGRFEFVPRLRPEDFRAAFVGPTGWGTISQVRNGPSQTHCIAVKHGQLRLKTLEVSTGNLTPSSVGVAVGETTVRARLSTSDKGCVDIVFADDMTVEAGQHLKIVLS